MSKVITFRADHSTIKMIKDIRNEWDNLFPMFKGTHTDTDVIKNAISLLYDKDVRKVLEINVKGLDNPE